MGNSSSQHALGTTWLPAAPGLQLPACPGNNMAMPAAPGLQLPACPGNNMAASSPRPTAPSMPREQPVGWLWEQPGWPRAYSSQHALGTTWPWGSPGPTAPSMPWEQTWLPAAPGLQLPACPGNNLACGTTWPRAYSSQHALGTTWPWGSPGPTAPSMPWEQHGCQQHQAYSSQHALGTTWLWDGPGPTAPSMPRGTLPRRPRGAPALQSGPVGRHQPPALALQAPQPLPWAA